MGKKMARKNTVKLGRRSLMSNLGAAALAGATISATPALAQNSTKRFEAKRHALDSWMDEIPGDHRVFIDTSDATGGSNSLLYGGNILNAHVNAYEGSDDEMAMIICFRHASTPFGYNNAMWKKYGEVFMRMTQQEVKEGEIPQSNPVISRVDSMVARGVHFAICNTATRRIASVVAEAAGLETDDVHKELNDNAIANGHYVPAGVMALSRAQEYGYSFMYSAA